MLLKTRSYVRSNRVKIEIEISKVDVIKLKIYWEEKIGFMIIPDYSFRMRLKGVNEDYTWGYRQNPLDYPVS